MPTSPEAARELWKLRQDADSHAPFTRHLMAPVVGPWRSYWRDTALDLQRQLDRALDRLEAALDSDVARG